MTDASQTSKSLIEGETLRDDAPVTQKRPELGELIDRTYRITEQLGHGGHGTVMLAHDEQLDRHVALKFLHPLMTRVEDQRRRFLNEARAMARIRHPNVVGIHAIGEWAGTPYLVMEYLPGPTLLGYLEQRDLDLDPDDAMGLFDQMCRGVAAIHEVGATHNDLKPSNMIIGPASRLGITDFGLAEWVRERGMRRGGTVGFIAPEVIRGDEVDAPLRTAADIYSLGVLAFILFTGRMPFVGDTAERVLEHQLTSETPKPSMVRSGIPIAFDDAIADALAPEPARRPEGVAELLAACSVALAGVRRPSPSAPRILVIEDDEVLHPWFEAALQIAVPGAEVACFVNPVEALADIERERPRLVITDLNMPNLDGYDVVQILRSRPETEHVPIVAITGSATRDGWERLTTLGADGFLTKPFEPTTLGVVVRRMLARSN